MVNLAFDISSFCSNQDIRDIIRIIGYILFIFKLVIPLLIVALGIFDFGKAVVAEKEDEIKKQTKRLLFRVIAGIVIFLIPTLVIWIFSAFAKDYEKESDDFEKCKTCFIHPKDCS